MINLFNLLNDNGPEEVFIFYSFLLFNRKQQLIVENKEELRKTFYSEITRTNEKWFLTKDTRKDLKADIIKSYLYIKSRYF